MAKKLSSIERLALILCGILLALSVGLYLYGQALGPTPEKQSGLGGDFTLQGVNGPVSLSDFNGKGVVLMFGYTYCPDVCPTGLANLGAAMNRLSEEQQQQVQPIFVSVDPDRDTAERLDDYTRYFYPNAIGITGSKSEIDKVVNAYGAFYRMVEMPDSAMAYSVDHSARIYLIDRDGNLNRLIDHNAPVADLSSAIKALL
ncbi:SCO family protein [Motiliproteus coralliicola]|uniref:SCO family protein n=1 Tax=Motiliproteus coralliicola TaxID=2283196 RepID=A0A369WUA9_9GAMM|nr:SCO family protein [Motiliproteus coralliicola]RDE25191.1 SCO family protein [Motiliproteus coralliicola]